jgi:hypothetical protein
MKSSNLPRRVRPFAALLCLACLLAVPLWADDPPQEDPEAGAAQAEKKEPTPAPKPGSLADAAARIKLQQPAEGGSSGLVISDQNLKEKGSGAALSQGTGAKLSGAAAGGAGQGKPAGPSMTPEQSAAANDIVQRYQAQLVVVQGLEVRLANWDERLAEPSHDPYYPKYSNSPQNRAPGQVDEAEGTRNLLAKHLAEERKKLDAIRNEAKRAGVALSEPAVQPVAPE